MALSRPRLLEKMQGRALLRFPVRPRFWGRKAPGLSVKDTGQSPHNAAIWDAWFTSEVRGTVQWVRQGEYTNTPTNVYPGETYKVEFTILNTGSESSRCFADLTVPGESPSQREFFNANLNPGQVSGKQSFQRTTERALDLVPGVDINGQSNWAVARQLRIDEEARDGGGSGTTTSGPTEIVLNVVDENNNGAGSPDFYAAPGATVSVRGILRDTNYNGISAQRVKLTMPDRTVTITTNSGGQWDVAGTIPNLAPGTKVNYVADFAGNGGLEPSSDKQTVTISPPPDTGGDGSGSNDPGGGTVDETPPTEEPPTGWTWPLITALQKLFGGGQ